MSLKTEPQSDSDIEVTSDVTQLSFDLEGLDLIDETQNLSLFTAASFSEHDI